MSSSTLKPSAHSSSPQMRHVRTVASQSVSPIYLERTLIPVVTWLFLKHLELVSLQEHMSLAVLVLRGATVRQQLISFEHPITQEELRGITDRLVRIYSGMTAVQIDSSSLELTTDEKKITECILKLMKTEDEQSHTDSYMDGLHYLLNHRH